MDVPLPALLLLAIPTWVALGFFTLAVSRWLWGDSDVLSAEQREPLPPSRRPPVPPRDWLVVAAWPPFASMLMLVGALVVAILPFAALDEAIDHARDRHWEAKRAGRAG